MANPIIAGTNRRGTRAAAKPARKAKPSRHSSTRTMTTTYSPNARHLNPCVRLQERLEHGRLHRHGEAGRYHEYGKDEEDQREHDQDTRRETGGQRSPQLAERKVERVRQ